MIFNFVVSKEVCILYASLNLVGVRREFAKIDTIHRAVGSSENPGGQGLLKEKFLLLFLPKVRGWGGRGSFLSPGSDGPAFSKKLC
jgi:hypothetical protein